MSTITTSRIDTSGVAQILGCSRRHATNTITKRPDFPKPVINISQKTRFWSLADVLRWAGGK